MSLQGKDWVHCDWYSIQEKKHCRKKAVRSIGSVFFCQPHYDSINKRHDR